MTSHLTLFPRGRRARAILQLVAVTMMALPAVNAPNITDTALADPAAGPGAVTVTTPGAISGTVPDGTCFAKVTAVGAGGASSPAASGAGGVGGAGASISATFAVVPGQSYGGTVGAGGTVSNGGAGYAAGGNGGLSDSNTHRGGGGGGATSVVIGGSTLVIAGGGGGGGGAHSASPVGNGGGGGFSGIAAGGTAAGTTGQNGNDTPNTANGGQGGQSATGGNGGTNTGDSSLNGSNGAGTATGTGGNGGHDTNADTGGGGGGGYTGGGGGAATVNQGGAVTGGGGGGGSSRVAATSPVASAPAPTGVSGAAGSASPSSAGPGVDGSVTIDWLPCLYDLALTKSASPTSINAGAKATWTVTVKNNGANVMTKGDTVVLTDTLPAGPNGTPAPAYKVTSFTDTPGSSSGGLSSGALTCTGVTVGSAMPSSTTCTRAYSAPSAGGAPSGGTRGLDVGEQITIVYEQIISETAPCATITNTATVKDRPSQSGSSDITGTTVTDTVNTPLTINCYDLAITKTVDSPTVARNQTVTWTVSVTNNGPGPMTGPDDTTANPLVITDNFPAGSNLNATSLATQTGPAGPCSLASSTVTCTSGLAAGATEALTFTATVKSGAGIGNVINNTATVSDPKTGDSNDSSTATTTVRGAPTLNLAKSVTTRANSADQFTVKIAHGATTDASATTSGSGTSASTGATTLTAGTTYTLTDAMAAGSVSTIGQYTKSISCSNTFGSSTTTLPSGSGASFSITPAAGDVITCTFTNSPTAPTVSLAKSVSSRGNAADQFTVKLTHGATTDASATTSGSGTSATTGTTTVTAGTTYTLSEVMAAGSVGTLADYDASIACTNSFGSSVTTLPSGTGTSFTVTPAAADAISCTITNAAKPHITFLKSITSRVVSGDQFTVKITHGVTTDASATTSGSGTSATTGSTALTAGTTYTLSEVMAGGTSSLSDYLNTISCSNSAGGSATVLPSGSGTSFTVTPAAADNITCTLTNTAKPHVTFVKSVASRADASDQFTVKITHGATTDASATTSGSGTSATTGSTALTAGTTYTLSEVMAAGSSSVLGQYASSISCSNTASGAPTVLPSGSGTSFSLTPVNGDNITCTLTNTAGTATLGLTKSASPSSGVSVGSVITYTYGVTNTGTLPLTNVTVSDPHSGLSAISCSPAQGSTLAAGATMSCTATYTVTQADVDAGSIVNTGTVSGKDPSNNTITKTAGKTVTTAQSASFGLTKSASPSSGVAAGDSVTYTISGTNTGSVTLHNVSVSDPMVGILSCTPSTPATLAPGAGISCTGSYTVTQANVNAGSFTNTASIGGLDPSNNAVGQTASKTVTANQVSTLGLTKAASPSSGVVAGDTVTYTMTGTNTGTVALHNVSVSDPMVGTLSCTPTAPATLPSGATISCTGSYTVTQTNVDAGSFTNTATVNGLNPANAPVSQTAGKTVTATQSASVLFSKSASPSSGVVAGDTVTYTFTGQNNGTVTLHNVGVSDPMAGLSAIGCAPAAPATLAPSATISCTATHTVTQADVDAGSIHNTATLSGLDPSNAAVVGHASATVNASQVGALALSKTASPSAGVVAGDTVTYTIDGQNTGSVTLHGVGVTDPMSGLSAIGCTPAAPATLAPGATIHCTATYTVTQADVDAGSIGNTATVSGLTPAAAPVTQTAGATVTADHSASLALTKSASPTSGVVAGDTVTYTFGATNTGVVTVHDVVVTDPMPGLSGISCTPAAPATLAPGASMSCSATYTVTQADVDGGGPIVNDATVSGLDPGDGPTSDTATASVTVDQTADLSFGKTASPDHGVVAGDTVTYTFTGENTGTVTLHDVEVVDPMTGLSAITCVPAQLATLAPGDTIDCSATYTVTQADVDAGSIVNNATLSGVDPNNVQKLASAGATVLADQSASLSLTKSASPSSGVVAGDVVTYTLSGSNTGAVSVHDVQVSDPMSGLTAISCTPAQGSTLAAGDSISCSASYTVTQADVDAGIVSNTATISGLDPSNTPTSATGTADVTTSSVNGATFSKSVSPSSGLVAGDTATYTFSAKNTGDRTLQNATVSDPMAGLGPISCAPAQGSDLAPNATMTCSATYTVTQADVDAGSVTNTAHFAATPSGLAAVDRYDSATFTTDQTPGISFGKSATPTSNVAVGDVVTYSFTGANTGTVTLDNAIVSDPMPGLSALTCVPAAPATLAPGAGIDCSATYTVTQADVDAGSISNTATIDGTDPGNTPVSDTAGATVTAAQSAHLSLAKTATPSSGVTVGDTITYSFTGTNDGTVTLHGVDVTDPMSGLGAISCAPAAPATLAPGDTIDCSATYTVTQADVDAGSIHNTATVSGLDPSDTPTTGTDSATVTTAQAASLSLAKSASPSSGVVAGDTVTYSFDGQNTGTVSLHNVTVADPMSGLGPIGCTPAAPAALAPDATIHCTATYTVTQADVDHGSIDNTATIAGLDPANAPTSATGSTTVTADTSASVSFTKTASPTSGVVVGDTVTYTFSATNTGAVTLHDVAVTDPMSGLSAVGCVPTTPATLAPGDNVDCTATYTVTQADVDAGSISNTASLDALDPANHPVTRTAGATVPTDQTAGISLSKTASPTSGVSLGDTVTYTMVATNTGAVSLHGVAISDPLSGLSALSCTPSAPATLASGAAQTCTGTYTVTQADVDAGSISNTATVDSLDPSNNPVTDTASRTVLVGQTASLSLAKTASPSSNVNAGDTITYSFDVTNTGTVSVTDVGVTDPMSGLSTPSCTPGAGSTLAPAATMHCTATYTVTQADVDAGSIVNTATVGGLDPANNPVAATDTATVTARQVDSLTLTKTASPSGGVAVGDVITYTMTAANAGTVTVTNTTITDPMTGLSALDCTPAQGTDLAPGASMTCTATYTVTAADVAHGSIDNTASVHGDTTGGHSASSAASAVVPTVTSADVTLDKKLGGVSGSTATWLITVTNTGTGPYPGPFSVTDSLPDGLGFESAAGDGWVCTGTSTVTCTHADDLATGAVATVTVSTKITGSGKITNVASMDVAGKTVQSDANYTPGSGFAFTGDGPTSGFAFTGSDAFRYGGIGLLLLLVGSVVVTLTRRRRDDDDPIVEV
ncbi:MAG: beta strand repeat-containing protein [Acidimicrobiia bacterium]